MSKKTSTEQSVFILRKYLRGHSQACGRFHTWKIVPKSNFAVSSTILILAHSKIYINPSLVRSTHLSRFNSFESKWVIWVFLQACQTRALPLSFSTKLCPLVNHLIDIDMKTPKYYCCMIFPLKKIQQICQTQLLII